MLKRKKSADNAEEQVNLDRYLITYADLITLLLGLFVILYATSQVDESKFKQFSQAFSAYFSVKNSEGVGGGVFDGLKDGIPEPIMPYPSHKTIVEIKKETEEAFKDYLKAGTIGLKRLGGNLILTLPEKLLFVSGKADIEMEGIALIDTLAGILKGIDKLVTIDGHTDSNPINNFKFPSNWHLSVARAVNVGYKLFQGGLPGSNLGVRGFADKRPVSDNSSEVGRSKNRRVEITISEIPQTAPSKLGYEKQD